MPDYDELSLRLGYTFTRRALFKQALTHPSYGTPNNQRLEFLGDAVLQLCISDLLYADHTNLQEGMLTHLRQRLVREDALATVARQIELGSLLRMDRSCEQSGGRDKSSVLSDAMEAVLAAIYLDGGISAAYDCVKRLWPQTAEVQELDSKSALQEYLQARGHTQPQYDTLSEDGPAHQRVFTVAVTIEGKEYAQGTGTTKKKAEQIAAQKALTMLKQAGE